MVNFVKRIIFNTSKKETDPFMHSEQVTNHMSSKKSFISESFILTNQNPTVHGGFINLIAPDVKIFFIKPSSNKTQ